MTGALGLSEKEVTGTNVEMSEKNKCEGLWLHFTAKSLQFKLHALFSSFRSIPGARDSTIRAPFRLYVRTFRFRFKRTVCGRNEFYLLNCGVSDMNEVGERGWGETEIYRESFGFCFTLCSRCVHIAFTLCSRCVQVAFLVFPRCYRRQIKFFTRPRYYAPATSRH